MRSTEDYTVGISRRSVTATFTYLIGAPIPGECVCGTEAVKRTRCQLVFVKLSSVKRMWVVNMSFQGKVVHTGCKTML